MLCEWLLDCCHAESLPSVVRPDFERNCSRRGSRPHQATAALRGRGRATCLRNGHERQLASEGRHRRDRSRLLRFPRPRSGWINQRVRASAQSGRSRQAGSVIRPAAARLTTQQFNQTVFTNWAVTSGGGRRDRRRRILGVPARTQRQPCRAEWFSRSARRVQSEILSESKSLAVEPAAASIQAS